MPPFGGRIAGRILGAVFALHGGEDDDPAFVLRHHLGREGTNGVGRAVQIVVNHVAPVGILHLQERDPALDGGVGHHDIDLAVASVHIIGDAAQG